MSLSEISRKNLLPALLCLSLSLCACGPAKAPAGTSTKAQVPPSAPASSENAAASAASSESADESKQSPASASAGSASAATSVSSASSASGSTAASNTGEKPQASTSSALTPEKTGVTFKVGGKTFRLNIPSESRFSAADNHFDISALPPDCKSLDLSGLQGWANLEDIAVTLINPLDSIRIPAIPSLVGITILCDKPLGRLEVQAPITRVEISGDVQEVNLPETVQRLIVNGQTNLRAFAKLAKLDTIIFTEPSDLNEVKAFPQVHTLCLYGEAWDLTPLPQLKQIRTLRVYDLNSQTLSAIAGSDIETLRLSDETVDDLLVLTKLPKLKTLELEVSDLQPKEIVELGVEPLKRELLPELDTTLPKEQLEAFLLRGGQIRLFREANHNFSKTDLNP